MARGIFSTEMMEKFFPSSIREGTRVCLSSSFPSPPGELVREEVWREREGGGEGGGERERERWREEI